MANLTEKFTRSWRLFGCSFQIMGKNKQLLLFPALAFVFIFGCMIFFLLPILLYPTGQPWSDSHHWQEVLNRIPGIFVNEKIKNAAHAQPSHLSWVMYLYWGGAYLLMMIGGTFCNVAFYNEIIKALAGEKASLMGGLSFACSRFRSIVMWSLFAGLVGIIIQTLEQRSGWIGRIVLGLVGMAWSVASVFVIPVMIREETSNPITLLQNSAATLKKTWGEALIGYLGMSFSQSVIVFGTLPPLIVAMFVCLFLNSIGLFLLIFFSWLFVILTFTYLMSCANHIYRCALYVYASEGVPPTPFTTEQMDTAWKVKKA